jgi:asparagine synthase (glutamine-hydrolysing)
MGCRYIALLNDGVGVADDGGWLPIDKFRHLALEHRGRVGRATIFTSKETPTLSLPGGAVLLGDLYDSDGRPVANEACFQYLPTQRALRQHLLDHCWGEYLLIQPVDEDSDGVAFMRDPSGAVACAHSPKNGFVTSDPSIASHLGLYREKIDWEFVSHCLIYPYMKISRTGLAGIRELLPGCVLTVANKTTHTELAWSPWNFVVPTERQCDPIVAAQTIRDVTTSVVRAMAEADESLLLELSGGLDSSIVGVSLASARARIEACNAISPLPGADERLYAKQLADQLGIELLQRLLGFDEPPRVSWRLFGLSQASTVAA